MRKLKFRLWDEEQQAMMSWDEIFETQALDDGFIGNGAVLQQYTGLKDKNGAEIYEGDILKHDIGLGPIYYKVFWSNTKGAWMIDKNNGGDCGCWFDNYEIAGNIFENPELIK